MNRSNMSQNEILCSSCSKQKNELTPRASKLVPKTKLFLCGECIENRFEPRWLIILTARAKGIAAVEVYIKKRRYVGREITLKEIT